MAHILPPQPDGPTLQETTEKIVNELKSRGNFDTFRKACLADVDTRPAYQNLRQRVESTVTLFLGKQKWTPDLNRNQLREKLRKHLTESSFLEIGVDRIVDQVVDRNIYSTYMPQIQLLVKEMLDIKDEAEENADDDVEMEEATPAAPETGGNTFGTWANQFHARVPEPRPDEPAAASNSSMSISSATNESAAGSAAGSPSEGDSPDIRAQMSPLSDDGKQGWGSFLGKSDGLDFSGIMNRVGHIDPAIDQMIKSELESETRETEASAAPTQRSGSSNSNMSLQQEEETVDLQSFVGPPEGHEPHDSHRKDADRDPPLPPRPLRDEPDRGGRGDTEPRGRHPSDEERRRRERERDRDRGGRRDRPRHDDDRGSRHGDEDRYRRERDRDRDRDRGDRDRDRDRRDRDRGDDHEEQRSRARHHQRRDRDDDDASGHRGRSGGYSHGGRGHGRSDDRGGGGGGAGGSGQRYHGYNSGRERPAGKDEPMDGVAAEVEVTESVKDGSVSATVRADSAEATTKADGAEKRSVSKDRKDTSKERDRKTTSKERDRKRSESRSRRDSSSTHKKSSRKSDESSERKSSAKKSSSSEKRSDKHKHKTPSASSSGSTSPSKSSDRAAESVSKQKVNSGDSSPADPKSSSPASPSSTKLESPKYKSPQIKSDSKMSPVVSLERISDAMLRENHLSVPSSVAAEKSNTKPSSVTAKPSTVPSASTAEKSKSAPSSATADKPSTRPSSAIAKPNAVPSCSSADKPKPGPSSVATDKPTSSSVTPAKSSDSTNNAPSGTKDRMAQLMEKYAPYLKDRFRRSEHSSKPKPKPSSSRKSSSSSQNTYLGERQRPVSPSSRSRVRYLKQVIDDPETLSVSSVDTADLSDFDDNLDMELELTEPERDSLFKIGWKPVVDDLADADDDDVATAIEDFVQVVDLCDDAESVDSGFNRSDASSSTSAGSGRPASAVLPSDPPVIDLEPVAEAETEAPATGRRRRQRKVDYIALNSGLDGEDKEAGASRRKKRPRGDGDWNPDGKTSRVGPSRGAEAIPTLSLRRQTQGNVRGTFEKDEWQVSSDKENMDGMTRLRDPGAAGDSVRIRPNLII